MTLVSLDDTPGPSEVIDSGLPTVGNNPTNDDWERRNWLVGIHRHHKNRVREITQVANGEWYNVWPDLTSTPEAPTVANIIEMGIAHWGAIFGAMLPSITVPAPAKPDRSQGKRGARKRERRLRELWERCNISETSALLGGDYAGAGAATAGVWADFLLPPAERDPYVIRFDPRHTYPLKDNLGNITVLLVARRISLEELKVRFPEHAGTFSKSQEGFVEEWFWWEQHRLAYQIADYSDKGKQAGRGVTIFEMDNPLGFVPIWETPKPSFDGERRGVFDQVIHVLGTMHRLMTLTIASTEEAVYPAVVEFNAVNPNETGPGATIHLRSADGKVDYMSPKSHFDAKDLIARLGEEARQQASWPQQLSGEPGASIVSARGIVASMGALDARLALAHRQFEHMFTRLCMFLLAVDEQFCYGDKQIWGNMDDVADAEDYNPARDVNGNYRVKCTYGIAAGSDPANVEMRIAMHLANQLVSRETARKQLPWIEDDELEETRRARELVRDAMIAGLAQRSSEMGDVAPAAEFLRLLENESTDIDEVVKQLIQFMTKPEEPAAGDGGVGMAQAAESLARGGIPGNAEGLQSFGLPPLQGLLGAPGGTPPPNQVA